MHTYEVEIKSLLGNKESADALRTKMKGIDPESELLSQNRQLNHYFEPEGDASHALLRLAALVAPHISTKAKARLDDIASHAKEYSVRTRDKDNIVLLVVKASVGDDSSANGVSRVEFEEQVPLGLVELDDLVLSCGFRYQAKWSREREEYCCLGVNVCLDKNAGYGYVAEFERVVDDPSKVDAARAQVKSLMERLGAVELPQARLERMFAHYNANWQDYYGTDKIFVIE